MNVAALAARPGIPAGEPRSICAEAPGIDPELAEAGRAPARRFRLSLGEPLGLQLVERGVLGEGAGPGSTGSTGGGAGRISRRDRLRRAGRSAPSPRCRRRRRPSGRADPPA